MAQLGFIVQSIIFFHCLLRTLETGKDLEIKDLEIGKWYKMQVNSKLFSKLQIILKIQPSTYSPLGQHFFELILLPRTQV